MAFLRCRFLNVGARTVMKVPEQCGFLSTIQARTIEEVTPVTSSMKSLPLVSCATRSFRSCSSQPPKDDKVVYEGDLNTKVIAVKFFSLSTSMLTAVFSPVIMYKQYLDGTNLAVLAVFGMSASFFTFITPILINYMCKRYVLKIFYNEQTDTFTAHCLSFFLRNQYLSFKPEDVHAPTIPGPLTTIEVEGKPLLFDTRSLSTELYLHLMGYDNPVDFKDIPGPSE